MEEFKKEFPFPPPDLEGMTEKEIEELLGGLEESKVKDFLGEMMNQLVSKELLYDPMKELRDKV
jgi:hypothetical protein